MEITIYKQLNTTIMIDDEEVADLQEDVDATQQELNEKTADLDEAKAEKSRDLADNPPEDGEDDE
jgi:uncharacterized membrane protein (DUF106 family)